MRKDVEIKTEWGRVKKEGTKCSERTEYWGH